LNLRKFISILAVTFLFLTGCQMGTEDTTRDDRSPLEETRHTRDDRGTNDRLTDNVENKDRLRTDNRRGTDREHDRFEVAEEAAERIVQEVEEIGQAYVLTSRKNAYVAATLRENDRSPGDRSGQHDRERRIETKDTRDSNVRADDRSKDEHPSAGDASNIRDPERNVQNRNYRGDEISEDVKKKVSDIVKETDKSIENVYVTTSPDFFNLTTDYVDDFQNGRPVEGFFDKIGNMIERVFPQKQR